MEDVCNQEAIAPGDFFPLCDDRRQVSSWDDSVLDVVVRTYPSHRSKSALASVPDFFALGVIGCHPGLTGMIAPADRGDRRKHLVHSFRKAVNGHTQDSRGMGRATGV